MTIVVDTSVAVAWYLSESFSKPARVWQEKILTGQAHALVPSLHYLEFANVLRTYVRRKEMQPDLANEIYALHLDAPLNVEDPPRDEILRTALEFDASTYDATFIAIAKINNCPLLTAERSTTPWVIKLGKHAVTLSSP
jgi:predicted nucleic acid-binding protein